MTIKIDFVHKFKIDNQLVRNFFRENWKRKIALPDKNFYEWQFVNAPENKSKDCCIIAFDTKKEKIFGALGINKRTFFLENKPIKSAEFTTWVVSKDTKKLGLASNIGLKILLFSKLKFDILIGMGSTEEALPLYMRSGFKFVKSIPRFVKVINLKKIEKFSKINKLGKRLLLQWDLKDSFKNKYSVIPVTDKQYQKLFNNFKKKNNLFSRDLKHKKWRFKKHPYYNYKEFLVKKNGTNKYSYISFRQEDSIKHFKMIHLIDLYGDEFTNECALNYMVQYAKKNSYDVIDFYCTSSRIFKHLINNNWFSINDDDCFQFPHLFQPVEMRNPPTTSLLYWSKKNLSDLANFSKLYVTKQDVDLDRPTMHTINQINK
tara:strand:+ start:323 stop:1444 length:1122 start_codon:yes stop_codon:yes gene_type:complete